MQGRLQERMFIAADAAYWTMQSSPCEAGRLIASRHTSKGCCEKNRALVFRLRSIVG